MIAIVDYKAGNLTSVRLALAALGAEGKITSDPAVIRSAERVIFPGVGAIGAAMAGLRELKLDKVLPEVIASGRPFLGICIGLQVLLEHSEEDGGVAGLGLISGRVRRFQSSDRRDKVPQIGWNTVRQQRPHPVLAGIPDDSEFYFVHSYYPSPTAPGDWLGRTEYAGASFAAIIARDNLVATQFHTERSGRLGLRLMGNFLSWNGTC